MSHFRLAIGGVIASCFVLVAGIAVLSFYSFKKFTSNNTFPETVENIMMLAILNLAIMWAYFVCTGDFTTD